MFTETPSGTGVFDKKSHTLYSVGKQSPCLLLFVHMSYIRTVFEMHKSSENTHRYFHIMKNKNTYRLSYAIYYYCL